MHKMLFCTKRAKHLEVSDDLIITCLNVDAYKHNERLL